MEKPLKRMKQLSRICKPFSSFTNYKAKVVSPNSHFTEKIYYNICPIFRFATRLATPGAPLTYFNDGGVRRIFLGLAFRPKGIFLGL